MLTPSRRDVILPAAAAGATFGLDKCPAISAAPVKKPQTPDPNPGFHKYKVGEAEVIALYDGIWENVHDSKYFGNASVADIKTAMVEAGLTAAFLPIPITVFAVRLNGKLILWDVGGGSQVQAFYQQSVFVSGKMMAGINHGAMAEASRRKLFDRVAADQMLICGSHPVVRSQPDHEGRGELCTFATKGLKSQSRG